MDSLLARIPPTTDRFFQRPLAYLNPDILPQELQYAISKPENQHGPVVLGAECALEALSHTDYDDFYHLTRGFVFGVVQNVDYSVDDCSTCNYIGDAFGAS